MSRRHRAEEKVVTPDAKYGNIVVTKFINCLMKDGKKSIAERSFYSALEEVGKSTPTPPLEVFLEAIDNLKPSVEVRSRRVGGATYQIPVDVRPKRKLSLAIKWLIDAACKRNDTKGITNKLSKEILDSFNKRGNAHKKKEDTHKMAEANKAFSHYRW